MSGDIEGQGAVDIADADIMQGDVIAVVECDVFGECFEAGGVWFDGDDAFQFSSARFLHGIVADIGAQFDDGHLIFEDGE